MTSGGVVCPRQKNGFKLAPEDPHSDGDGSSTNAEPRPTRPSAASEGGGVKVRFLHG